MDWKALAEQTLEVVKAVAPMVGLSEEVAAAENMVAAVKKLASTVSTILPANDQAELQQGLDEMMTALNAHAERTKASLG
jgi:hypothetical protein